MGSKDRKTVTSPHHNHHNPLCAHHRALRTRKRHQQEHRPQRPTDRSDPTQHAKGRTGDCPGPCEGATTRRTVTRGGGGGLENRPSLCFSFGSHANPRSHFGASGAVGDWQRSRASRQTVVPGLHCPPPFASVQASFYSSLVVRSGDARGDIALDQMRPWLQFYAEQLTGLTRLETRSMSFGPGTLYDSGSGSAELATGMRSALPGGPTEGVRPSTHQRSAEKNGAMVIAPDPRGVACRAVGGGH